MKFFLPNRKKTHFEQILPIGNQVDREKNKVENRPFCINSHFLEQLYDLTTLLHYFTLSLHRQKTKTIAQNVILCILDFVFN